MSTTTTTISAESPQPYPLDFIPDLGQQIDVDEDVIARLPPGARILSASRQGSTLWTTTAKLVVSLPDGTIQSYLLKIAGREIGKRMMQGEYESMKAIYSISPTFCPRPVGWGNLKDKPSAWYYLCDLYDRGDSPPDPADFCLALAELHRRSSSPNGKFGFHVTTFKNTIPQEGFWADTWEEYFTLALLNILKLDEEINGQSEELVNLSGPLFEIVIPRLLRPLESNGRKVKPCLLHGDLRFGNSGASDTGAPIVFDAVAFYGHNEYEMGNWRPIRSRFDRRYIRQYTKHIPISEPKEDFDDRNRLYSLRFGLMECILYPGSTKYRSMVVTEMKYLVDKFAGGNIGITIRQQ